MRVIYIPVTDVLSIDTSHTIVQLHSEVHRYRLRILLSGHTDYWFNGYVFNAPNNILGLHADIVRKSKLKGSYDLQDDLKLL